VAIAISKDDREEAKAIVERIGGTPDKAIPLLQEIQRQKGYIPEILLEAVSGETGIPVSDLFGVATFYSQFRFTPSGEHLIKLCKGTACHVAGADILLSSIKGELGIDEGDTTEDGVFTLEVVACLGCCSLAPVVMIDDTAYGKLTGAKIRKILKGYRDGKK
jgi:NADH-quinone oxidoreductase subunit E